MLDQTAGAEIDLGRQIIEQRQQRLVIDAQFGHARLRHRVDLEQVDICGAQIVEEEIVLAVGLVRADDHLDRAIEREIADPAFGAALLFKLGRRAQGPGRRRQSGRARADC